MYRSQTRNIAFAFALALPLLAAVGVSASEVAGTQPENTGPPGGAGQASEEQQASSPELRLGLPDYGFSQRAPPKEPLVPGQALDFRKAIRALESRHGAYAGQLAEYLDSLGVNLQRRGMHEEAIEVFKRGVHLSRVNEGLYSAGQIPLLEKEIASLVALGDYAAADERQYYLYRVQMRNLDAGPDRAEAFLNQADWQYNAYRMGLERDNFNRLLSIWDLNSLALNDIAKREGPSSIALIAPLRGMLQAQYLIADYNFNQIEYGMSNSESYAAQAELNRFNAYRSQSYSKGEAVVDSIYDIQVSNYGQHTPAAAEARAMHGDWLLYHGKRGAAEEQYRLAVAELEPRDDAQTEIERLFGAPLELPDDDAVRYLPAPVGREAGRLVLQFDVSASGRVSGLERLDSNDLDQGVVNRIMRTLRHTRFRPRIERDGPVDSEEVIRAYDIE